MALKRNGDLSPGSVGSPASGEVHRLPVENPEGEMELMLSPWSDFVPFCV